MEENTRNTKKDDSKEAVKKNWIIRPLRTYKSDVARAVKKGQESFVSIAAAESKRKERKPHKGHVPEKPRTRLFLYALAVLLVVLGVVSVLFVYFTKEDKTPQGIGTVPSLIFADLQTGIDVTDISGRALTENLEREVKNSALPLGNVEHLYLTKKHEAGIELVQTQELFNLLNTNIPSPLLRSLEPEFMIGTHVFDGNQPFVILKTRFYENAFAGMLAWEDILQEDLEPLFGNASRFTISTATRSFGFVDRVVRNNDVRTLSNEAGEVVLLYAFPDQKTIIITTNENTFAEILTRMKTSRILR
jgi:hypothetical protein|tara:strand:- start:11264 stop:12175 length:912 start_codon:yes stop_codon:yes gene_type:complete